MSLRERTLAAFTWVLSRLFFRSVEVDGLDRVPEGKPLLIVANHINSLVDPLLLLAVLPRPPRFLGKSTLWEMLVLRPWLALGGVIPIFRAQDGVDQSQNRQTFERCFAELAAGASIALFPEGISHSETQLQRLKTGAARIAMGAEENHGPLGLQILPVGLSFEAKHLFRSRALVEVGEAIDLKPWLERGGSGDHEAVRDLTATIDEALRQVTENYDDQRQARLIARAATILERDPGEAAGPERFASSVTTRRALVEAAERLRELDPALLDELENRVHRYDRLLAAAGLRDDQVAASYPPSVIGVFILRFFVATLILLPLAVIGIVLNWLPYRFCGVVAARVERSPDLGATYKVVGGLVGFPVFWTVFGAAAFLALGWQAALTTILFAPLSGLIALGFRDRLGALVGESRAFLVLAGRSRMIAELAAQRQTIRNRLLNAAELLEVGP